MKPVMLLIAGAANPHVPGYLRSMKGYADEIKLVAFSESDPKLHANAQSILEGQEIEVPSYFDFREMLDQHPEAEAILVGSDNQHHLEMFREAFKRGLHIYSMKVPTMIPEEGEELLELQRTSSLVFQVELELRHGAQFQKARELVRTGTLGKIKSISLSNISQSPIGYFPNWGVPELSYGKRVPLRPGAKTFRGGALTDHPHPIDLIHWITGEAFSEVTAFSSKNQRAYLEVEDHIVFTGRLTDGTSIMINPSYSNLEERAETRRLFWGKSLECNLKILGEKGCYYADYFDHPLLVMGENHASPNRMIIEGVPRSQSGTPMLLRFARRVRGADREEIDPTLEEALKNVRVMNAVYDSLYCGETVRLKE